MIDKRPGSGGGKDELVFVGLGGLGEIGMNLYLYGYGPPDARKWLMVDCGITFPEGEFDPGIDVILPDVRFIEENRGDLVGILITHAHEDHIGAVIELWPRLKAPVYATRFTAGMLRAKLAEWGGDLQIPINVVQLDSRFKLGPFDVELVTLAHSIPEMSALALRTPQGLVFHTGDFKFDATPVIGTPLDETRLKRLGEEGVQALIIDSTNAFREGASPSEQDVAKSLAEIIAKAKTRVAVTTFSSNVARIKAVAEAARAANRQVVVAGRALHRVIEVAVDTGYLPQGFRFLDQDQFKTLQRLCDLIIPADDHSPGALEAHAAEWIDYMAGNSPELAEIFTGGFGWLDHHTQQHHAVDFVDAKPEQQTAILDVIAFKKNETPENGPGIRFFGWARNLVTDAYYTSPIGIKDLGYMGNSAMSEFHVPEEALQHALKRSPFA